MCVHFQRAGAGALGGLLVLLSVPFPGTAQSAPISEAQLEAFRPRSIGPAVTGGRVHDVESVAGGASVLWVATATGGLWRSLNRGHTWVNVFEGMEVNTFGDVAVAPSSPQIVYAGTGGQNNRQSTSWGNGVYRSEDGGDNWEHLGLAGTRHIAEVQVHPRNPDVVYVAASGDLWNASEERGVYRSFDGGRSWRKVLYVDEDTGAIDLVLNYDDPDVVYAAMYQRRRRAWGFNGGGPGSGIYRSVDGGDTWEELTDGIPGGDKGRIGLAISHSNPMVLNALIEHAEESGTYRSTDGGDTWEKMSDHNGRPMYYSHVYIDPGDENVVYTVATSSYRSRDGGGTWEDISARPTYDVGVHADMHTMWINPEDPEHFYLAGDAGLHETYDGGRNYRRINNIPISQFYAIGVDMRDPYWVYGGLQDNHSFGGPSRTRRWAGILNDDWRQTGFGDGMYQQPDPHNSRYVYVNSNGGGYVRVDSETGDQLDIRPLPPEEEDGYRFDWVSPSLASRHTDGLVYTGGNRLFISRDYGNSWTRTEDLTREIDRDTLEIMGVRGSDISLSRNDGTGGFGEITIIAESPLNGSVLWVGTDDGNVQLSRDAGSSWTEVSRNVDGGGERHLREPHPALGAGRGGRLRGLRRSPRRRLHPLRVPHRGRGRHLAESERRAGGGRVGQLAGRTPGQPRPPLRGRRTRPVRLHRRGRDLGQNACSHHRLRRSADPSPRQGSGNRHAWARHLDPGRPRAPGRLGRHGGLGAGAPLPHPVRNHLPVLEGHLVPVPGGVRGRESR